MNQQSDFEGFLSSVANDDWLHDIRYSSTSAWTSHAPFMKYLVRAYKPRKFVELGVHYGFSYFTACQSIQELNLGTLAFAVDTWLGDEHAGFYDNEVLNSVVLENQKYSTFSKLIRQTFDDALENFENETIDLLHIDGLHTYEAVSQDFKKWLPKMHGDGVIILHDINVRHGDFGVYRLWKELTELYNTFEFNFGNGLGVVFLGKTKLSSIFDLKEIDSLPSENLNQLKGVFSAHGDYVAQHELQSTQHELQSTQHELQSTQHELQSTQHELQSTQHELQSTQHELQSTQQSKSWRYTLFLRNAKAFLSR